MQEREHLVHFDRLEDRLLRGGIAPRHVRGLVSELRAHFHDAVHDEMAKGRDRALAEQAARQRLGNEDSVVQSALAQPELRSLAARFPRFIFGSGPILLWIGAAVLSIAALVGTFDALRALGLISPIPQPEPLWLTGPTEMAIFFYECILPPLIGAAMIIVAVRQRLSLRWPVTGVALISLLAGTTDITVRFSTRVGEPGQLSVANSMIGLVEPVTTRFGTFRPEWFVEGVGVSLLNLMVVFFAYYAWQKYSRLKAV